MENNIKKEYKIEFNRKQMIEKLNQYINIIEDFDYHYEQDWNDDGTHYFNGLAREMQQLLWELELEKI